MSSSSKEPHGRTTLHAQQSMLVVGPVHDTEQCFRCRKDLDRPRQVCLFRQRERCGRLLGYVRSRLDKLSDGRDNCARPTDERPFWGDQAQGPTGSFASAVIRRTGKQRSFGRVTDA